MAKYFLLVKIFSRGRGSRVTRAAAYRAGERIRDERTGESYNYSKRKDVVHSEIILPSGLADHPDMEWARDRAKLWNAVEKAGTRRNSRLGREVLVILPPEISVAKRTELAPTFALELAEKYRNAVDFAVHEPRAGSDHRHHHAHVLMTCREVTPKGLGTRTILDLSGTERRARGLGPSKNDLLWIRERWAQLTNSALLEAGIQERVDHRSYLAQGLDRDPAPAMPQKVFYAERRSGRTAAGDEIRARHRERVEARLKGKDSLEQTLRKQKEEGRRLAFQRFREKSQLPKTVAYGALTRDERNQLRRQGYQANKDAINERRRQKSQQLVRLDDQTQKSGLEIRRERRREQYRAMSEDEREKMRERARIQYRNRVAVKKERELSTAAAPKPPPAPTAEESARKWQAYRENHGQGPTPEESAKNWQAYREAQNQPGSNISEDDESNTKRGRDYGASL
jgi:hypothetical protein